MEQIEMEKESLFFSFKKLSHPSNNEFHGNEHNDCEKKGTKGKGAHAAHQKRRKNKKRGRIKKETRQDDGKDDRREGAAGKDN
jgi:hypothetical protein